MIRRVEVDDYSELNKVQEGKLIVSEFAGKMHLEIKGGGSEVEVLFEDVARAWQAVKAY